MKSLRVMSLRKRLCEVSAAWMAADVGAPGRTPIRESVLVWVGRDVPSSRATRFAARFACANRLATRRVIGERFETSNRRARGRQP